MKAFVIKHGQLVIEGHVPSNMATSLKRCEWPLYCCKHGSFGPSIQQSPSMFLRDPIWCGARGGVATKA